MAGTSRTDNLVVQIGELLRRHDLQTALETPTSIFKLPESKTKDNPQAYSPCRLFLGPYHEFRPELQKMEIFKLQNAKKAKEKFELPEFTQLVDQLKELDVQIRACYAGNLPMGSEALAWRILIDGLFLLRLLVISSDDKGNSSTSQRYRIVWPVFNEQRLYLNCEENLRTTQIEMLKDLLKLENQIPIQVLKRVLPRNCVENLPLLFYKFCASVSPLSLPPLENPNFVASNKDWFPSLFEFLDESQHLLHFLYSLFFYQRFLAYGLPCQPRSGDIFTDLLNMMAKVIGVGFLQQLVAAVGLIQTLLGLAVRVRQSSAFPTGDSQKFPSASELKKVGVKFNGGDSGGRFDDESATLKLPIITMNDFCEVILTNVVALEVEAKLKPARFSNYVKLMSGLISTAKDVGILRRAGIIAGGRSDNEDDIIKLFKELGSLVEVSSDEGELSSKSFLNFELDIIEELREYYESCWVVRAERFGKRYICPVFQALMILVVVLLILIVVIRTVCDWFSCPKIFKVGYLLSVV